MNLVPVVQEKNTRSAMASTSKTSRMFTLKMLAIVASIFFVLGLERVVAQSQSANEPDLDLAIKLLKEQRVKEAGDILKRLSSQKSDNAEVWYYLGICYVYQKETKKATAAFETAIKLRPQFADAHSGLAYSLMRRGKIGEASIAAQRAISIEPKNADAHYTLGIISFRLSDRPEAVKHADIAIQSRPEFAEAYLLKSQALVQFLGPAVVSKTTSPTGANYREAAEALEQYVKLAPDTEDSKIWREQLASLQFWSEPANQREVFMGKQVTTKVQLISKPEPSYSEEAREANVSGTVILKAVFASDGMVKHIIILQALPNGLTEEAVRAARRIRFVPATIDGKPVSQWMQLEYNFRLGL